MKKTLSITLVFITLLFGLVTPTYASSKVTAGSYGDFSIISIGIDNSTQKIEINIDGVRYPDYPFDSMWGFIQDNGDSIDGYGLAVKFSSPSGINISGYGQVSTVTIGFDNDTQKLEISIDGVRYSDYPYDSLWGFVQDFGDTVVGLDLGIELTTVEDTKIPVINGESASIVNIDSPMSFDTILSNIWAYDETDGDLTHAIVVEQYPAAWNKTTKQWQGLTVGTQYATLSVTDSAGNKATLELHILVKDVTAPTFGISQSAKTQTISYTQTFDIDAFKASLLVTDNTDPSPTITVVSNTYTANKSVPGTYQVTYEAKDKYNLSAQTTITLNVVDDVKPVISGPTIINKPLSSTLTVNEIKAQLTANDIIDGNITNRITILSDEFTGYGNKVGEYIIVFEVSDLSGNKNTLEVTVKTADNIPPIFYVKDGYFVTVEDSVILTIEDMVEILQATGQLPVSGTTSYSLLSSDYFGNEQTVGLYGVSMRFVSNAGNELVRNLAINVIETQTVDGVIEEEQSIIDTMTTWIKENKLTAGLILVGVFLLIGGLVVVVNSNQTASKKSKYDRFRR